MQKPRHREGNTPNLGMYLHHRPGNTSGQLSNSPHAGARVSLSPVDQQPALLARINPVLAGAGEDTPSARPPFLQINMKKQLDAQQSQEGLAALTVLDRFGLLVWEKITKP
jgi:hypothetical protein